MHKRTQSFVDLAEARAVIIAPVQTTVRLCRITIVNWYVGVYEIALWQVRRPSCKAMLLFTRNNMNSIGTMLSVARAAGKPSGTAGTDTFAFRFTLTLGEIGISAKLSLAGAMSGVSMTVTGSVKR